MKIVHLICAARPNFMKVAPLYHALKKTDWCLPKILYTGQHRDACMSTDIMREFGITPDDNFDDQVDAIIVPGDVRDARKFAISASTGSGIPVVHLEAGLRSGDSTMPEEVNRIVIDHVSSLMWTSEDSGTKNLLREGRSHGIVEVGNIMIDTFEMLRSKIEAVPIAMGGDPYAVVTLHRPSNVDDPAKLANLWDEITELSNELPVVFPVHPRTKKQFCFGQPANVWLEPPMPYIEFMALVKNATIVITDSGGVQEETSYLNVPCATVRENTERPITISHGTNMLIKPGEMAACAQIALDGNWTKGRPIPLWDGKTAERCVASLKTFLKA